jgi:predicted PurR-regulated permease PerM
MAKLDDLKNSVQNVNLDDIKNQVQDKLNINVDEVTNNVRQKASELGDRASEIRNRVSERLDRMPKPIDPRTHAVLDYLVTGYFLCTAGLFWGRNRRAAGLALVNAGMVLGVSMMTDYTGQRMGANIRRLLSFKQHRSADIMQAAVAELGTHVLGLGSLASLPFHLQAGNEAMVIGLTDWEAGGQGELGELNVDRVKNKIKDIAA